MTAVATRPAPTPVDPAPPEEARHLNHGAVTAVVCLALGTVVAALSSLNVALPEIARSTHADETQMTWIVDAYSLVFAALLLPAGALGDRFGRRLTLIVGLTIFGAASLGSVFVDSADQLIAMRALLGVGAGLVMPATLSTITGTFSAEHRTKAVSVWAGVAGASAIIGLLTSGVLLEFWSWRSVFVFNVVLVVVALIGTLRFVPESADPDGPKLDIVGSILAATGLIVLVYSIIEAPTYGWTAARTLVGMVIGLLVLAVFVLFERRTPDPMLDPRIFGRRRLSGGTVTIFVQFFAFFGFILAFLQYLQLVRGDSPLVSALSILPLGLALMPTARMTPHLATKFGSRRVCTAGLVLLAVGLFIMSTVGADSSYWLVLAGLLPIGAGMGAAMTPATSAITEALPASQQGVGSAVNDLSRELGGALGIAVVSSVISSAYHDQFVAPADAPAGVLAQAKESFAAAAHVGGPVADAGRAAFVDAMQTGLVFASAAAVVGAVAVSGLMPRRRRG